MVEETKLEGKAADEDGLTVIALPPDKAQTMLDLVARLESKDADTSGFMLSLSGAIGSWTLSAKQKHATGTGCLSSPKGWRCSDVDRTPDDV